MILHYFKSKENTEKNIAKNIYNKILKNSNQILLDNNFLNEKNYNSSFEIVSILIIIYLQLNINRKIKNFNQINEELIKFFISDLDESLRIKGIGDMSIGKYVKSYVKKFYFRLSKFPRDIDSLDQKNISDYLSLFDFISENKIKEASTVIFNTYIAISNTY
tara:strand:+ start:115 stop:600 length:486 start_codon:yes stop_codon:yes gene_type:complete